MSEFLIGFIFLTFSCRGSWQEVAPCQTVRAMIGDDTVLPCHLKPPRDAAQMTVEWGKPDLEPRFVFVLLDGNEHLVEQNRAYKGRTSVSADKLKDGDVSLKLSDVRLSDNGTYRCYIPRGTTQDLVELLVGSVSSVGISLAGLDEDRSGVTLDCRSAGWFPEPQVLWLDGEGQVLPAGPAETSRGPDGLYSVSSRVTVEKRANNNITCRVHQKDINQSRETHVHVPEEFFVVRSNCSVPVSLTLVLFFVLILVLSLSVWKWRQRRISRQKQPENEAERLMEEIKHEKEKREEELLKILHEDEESLKHISDVFRDMKDELQEQKKQLSDLKLEGEKFEEMEKKSKEVDKDVDKTISKAEGYRQLKDIMTQINWILMEKTHEQMDVKTDKFIQRMNKEIIMMEENKHKRDSNKKPKENV